MACHQFGPKRSPEQTNADFSELWNNFQWNFDKNTMIFFQANVFENMGYFVNPQCVVHGQK